MEGGHHSVNLSPQPELQEGGHGGGVGCALPTEAVPGNCHVHVDTGVLAQCYLRCGLWTKNISLTWEFVTHPWAPPAKSGVAKSQTQRR